MAAKTVPSPVLKSDSQVIFNFFAILLLFYLSYIEICLIHTYGSLCMVLHLCVHVHVCIYIYIYIWIVPSLLHQTKLSLKSKRILFAIQWRFRMQISPQDKVFHKVILLNSSRLHRPENMSLSWISPKKPPRTSSFPIQKFSLIY